MTNIVILVGNIGADPESRTTQSGTSITNFSVATSRRYRNDAGDLVEQTEWHRVTAFNGLGKTVAQYVRKGMKVSVQGRLHYSKWTDQSGQTPLRRRHLRQRGRVPQQGPRQRHWPRHRPAGRRRRAVLSRP